MPLTSDEDIAALLGRVRTIALVGASDRPERPSYEVMATLQAHGYRVIPINPQIAGEHIHGEFVFGDMAALGDPIDWLIFSATPQRRETRWMPRLRWAQRRFGCNWASSMQQQPRALRPQDLML